MKMFIMSNISATLTLGYDSLKSANQSGNIKKGMLSPASLNLKTAKRLFDYHFTGDALTINDHRIGVDARNQLAG